ncbi:MAG: glutathione S-transferase family protein, partial [Paraburkholderia fungorum]|nr:glutathione S-transferase family protein [Paraburkholderia fungorum]
MIKLCGFALSNYYNKVKFVLLEHGIPFEEVFVKPSQEEAMLEHSPLGKVPYIQTEQGDLCESQAIVEYLAARFP